MNPVLISKGYKIWQHNWMIMIRRGADIASVHSYTPAFILNTKTNRLKRRDWSKSFWSSYRINYGTMKN